MKLLCPLCHSRNLTEIEKINISDLAFLYEKMLGESISHEFLNYKEIIFYLCKDCGLKFFYPLITGSENFYNSLTKRLDWYYSWNKNDYDFAHKYINESDRVLDIGSGRGEFAKHISSRYYTGLELSHDAKLLAEKNGINIVIDSIENHAKKNHENYDIICLFQVLEHIADVHSFLKSVIECLKPGGNMIVSVPNETSFLSFTLNNILNLPPHHVTRWPDESLFAIKNLFNLNILEFRHERLADVHSMWYSSTVAFNALIKIFKKSRKLIDRSLSTRILNKLAQKIGSFYNLGIVDEVMRPYGHSTTVIYRK